MMHRRISNIPNSDHSNNGPKAETIHRVCVCVRPCGRMWRGRWREKENFSRDMASCWWRGRLCSTVLRNTERHALIPVIHTCYTHSNTHHADIVKLTAAVRKRNKRVDALQSSSQSYWTLLSFSNIYGNATMKSRLHVLMLLQCHELSF